MSEQLPRGWVHTTLGAVTTPSHTRVEPTLVPDTKYVGLEHIEPHTMTLIGYTEARNVRSSCLRFSSGDVLYARLRPYLNKVWVAEFNGICSTEFIVFPNGNQIDNKFLGSRLNAPDFVTYAEERTTGDRPRASFKRLETFELILPTIAEQRLIVVRLNKTMSRLKNGERAARRALRRLDDYRAALLQSAVTGKITRSWRESHAEPQSPTGGDLLRDLLRARRQRWINSEPNTLATSRKPSTHNNRMTRYRKPTPPSIPPGAITPEGWAWASIDQLTWASSYGTSVKCGYDSDGPPVLRIPNIRNRTFDTRDLKFAPSSEYPSPTFVEPGDMLLIRTNGSIRLVGRAAVLIRPFERSFGFASYIIRFRLLGSELFWSWISLAWDSDFLRSILESRATTSAGQYNLSLKRISNTPIPIPPLTEQAEIVSTVRRRLLAADRFSSRVTARLLTVSSARDAILTDVFSGKTVSGHLRPPPHASPGEADLVSYVSVSHPTPDQGQEKKVTTDTHRYASIAEAWKQLGGALDARQLFDKVGYGPHQVTDFYEALRSTPRVKQAFAAARGTFEAGPREMSSPDREDEPVGHFRLVELWLADFRNLRDFTIRFSSKYPLNVVLGWNGTGKSNLFEALVMIFRDLHYWTSSRRWPDSPTSGFRLVYELGEYVFCVEWRREGMKRPVISRRLRLTSGDTRLDVIHQNELLLPRFVFGYYAGPTNRLADHFLPMKQAHYDRLREASIDDSATLRHLLEQRRFFCAETHHAKYVLLAFSYRDDPKISEFLARRLNIVGFESALFVVRKPRWARRGSVASDFWGATGIMRHVVERLRRHAIAPMVLEQRVNDGYRSTTEEHYYFFLPDVESLHAFAAEYADARAFFLALESTDFSELIHDVQIQVRISAEDERTTAITFRELSEGEQQLLMVLGLIRFTKSRESLVLLDEPDTHLNPKWSADYLKDLRDIMTTSANASPEHQSSQILMATHDPLVIGSLLSDQVLLLVREPKTGRAKAVTPSVDPRGLGFTGILTSEIFGFRSDLDEETLADLDERVRLLAREEDLSECEEEQLKTIDLRLERLGFSKAFSDPYYAAFVRAWSRRHNELQSSGRELDAAERSAVDQLAYEVLVEVVSDFDKQHSS